MALTDVLKQDDRMYWSSNILYCMSPELIQAKVVYFSCFCYKQYLNNIFDVLVVIILYYIKFTEFLLKSVTVITFWVWPECGDSHIWATTEVAINR